MTDRTSIMQKYFLESTGNRTDVTDKIEELLEKYGVCLLGAGDYYVSGIKMPIGSSLIGVGNATRVILAPETECGAAIKLNSFCTVKTLSLLGSADKIELPSRVGCRHGILFEGSSRETKDHENQPRNSTVESCFISSFVGGCITCNNTGYSPHSSLCVSNCHLINSGAGIYIPYFSEYHEFTNILSTENLYGCINNGGNNVFTNCGFNSNKTGFVIDNSDGKANNQAHGSAVGCTFNHSDSNRGVGIAVYGAKWGYVFSGCQIWYSRIVLHDSTNITFNATNVGRQVDTHIKGGALTLFSGCAFMEKPNIVTENNDCVRFSACYTKDGEEVKL